MLASNNERAEEGREPCQQTFHYKRLIEDIGNGPRAETGQQVARTIRDQLARGDLHLGPSADESLETYSRQWLKGLSGNLKASTVRFYSDNLERHIVPLIGRRAIGSIARADCRELSLRFAPKRPRG